MACIDFSELVPGSIVAFHGPLHLDAVELSMTMTGKNRNHAGEALRMLDNTVFQKEKLTKIKLPGKGNRTTYTVHIRDAVELAMVLPGKTSKFIRKKFADIIVRYLDGDISLCSEIKENKTMGRLESYNKFIQDTVSQVKAEQEQEQAGQLPKISYIYATKSAAFPGLVKIGKTQDVAQRLIQLNTSCAPSPHSVVAAAATFDKDSDEKKAHQYFSAFRREGEFFEVSELAVKNYFSIVTAQFQTEMSQRLVSLQGTLVDE